MTGEQPAHLLQLPPFQMEGAASPQLIHARPHPARIAPDKLEEEPFEIARKLNVHARTGGGYHALRLVGPRVEGAIQTVIGVRGNYQALDRKSHRTRGVTRENITEISGRHGEGDRPIGAA